MYIPLRLPRPRPPSKGWGIGIIVVLALLVLGGVGYYFSQPPSSFPRSQLISVEEGHTLSSIATQLEDANVIRSPLLFEILVGIYGNERAVKAGDYFFRRPQSIFAVAQRFADSDYGITPVKVTIPEGSSVREVAAQVDERFPHVNEQQFIAAAEGREGYLFPDTYYFLPTVSAEHMVEKMQDTFEKRIADLRPHIKGSPHSLHEVVTMASLIEEEALTYEHKRMIAGILWRRREEGMPLQVDAVFPYIIGKNTYELTHDDLEIDSPYNTYKYKGLPPGPITNPGKESIRAALSPKPSSYVFYLSDRSGNMYYAETFDQHKANKRKYME